MPPVNDANCTGHCWCPWCHGPAYWNFVTRLHACADADCEGAQGFEDHTANETECPECRRADCSCD